ncbi:NADP-dependent oxidoreductase [Calidifontibacter sp. DB0510]|uniref:NADP-dependent oxidoreductase n=1 Tax=Metallococcus carri TaxID=1656884 RepID=A0A967B0R2_9MICO|nr:NADP-dependent oxidoreductase [Metallococcus carri]NHN55280.1 NADP-dependent oxidoreductase [Metallococcus carri]NOP36357.1 NADP-dependent oxidoreductase [Calidifontibacter sp. DB2511S]
MTDTTRVVLAQRPHGEPTDSDLVVEQATLPDPQPGQALLQTLYLSLDPYMRGRMSDAKSYAPPVEIGGTMVGATVSRVIDCPAGEFAPGDIVLGYGGWQTYSVEPTSYLRRLDPEQAPVTTALGVLGMPGMTAYAGLLEIGRPQAGETVVVAAATGPVGSAVGQIARAKGARAVGIAGGPEKVAYLRELGFDAAVDHRAPDFVEQLAAATPDGIDVYFENVGGAVFDAVFPRMNTFGRIPVCGLVSGYNATELPDGPDRVGWLMSQVLRKSLTVRGFIQSEFADRLADDFQQDMSGWIADGTVKYREDIVDGFDNVRDAFRGLLKGGNFGKLVVKIAD